MNVHIFHIFSLPNLFKILYSWDSIFMCDKLIDIYFYASKPYSFFQISSKTCLPPERSLSP